MKSTICSAVLAIVGAVLVLNGHNTIGILCLGFALLLAVD